MTNNTKYIMKQEKCNAAKVNYELIKQLNKIPKNKLHLKDNVTFIISVYKTTTEVTLKNWFGGF